MKKIITLSIGLVFGLVLAGTLIFAEDETAVDNSHVKQGDTVTINYTLTVDEEVIHSSDEDDPLVISVGNSQLIPAFEKKLLGMASGETKSFEIQAEDGYGEEDPSLFKEIPKDQFPADIELETGKTIYVKGPDGQAYPVKVQEIKDESVVMNFNHPLAGKKLKFDIELVAINADEEIDNN